MPTMRNVMVGAIALVLMAAGIACGGAGDDTESPPASTAADDAATEDAATEDADSAGGAGRVIVTIGAETFEFDVIRLPGCVRIGGQVSGSAAMTDAAVTVNFTIPPEDWETNDNFGNPPSIAVLDRSSEPAVRWGAGEGVGGSVDSYAIDGGSVSGNATFRSEAITFASGFVSETTSGTFEIDCGD
jgi:hypothetical protein